MVMTFSLPLGLKMVTKGNDFCRGICGKPRASIPALVEIPKKPDINLIAFKDSQAAIDGTLEAWLPRLIESNEALVAALERIKKLYSSGEPVASKEVLLEINTALEKAAAMQRGL
jgi:hypothetical protein